MWIPIFKDTRKDYFRKLLRIIAELFEGTRPLFLSESWDLPKSGENLLKNIYQRQT